MIKRLRTKFIRIAMLSVALVLLALSLIECGKLHFDEPGSEPDARHDL